MCARLLKIYGRSHFFELRPNELEDESAMHLENPGPVPVYFQFRSSHSRGIVNCSSLGRIRPGEITKVTLHCVGDPGGVLAEGEELVNCSVKLFAWNLLGSRDADGREVPEQRDIDCHVYLEGTRCGFTINICVCT